MSSTFFRETIAQDLKSREGGYTNDPDDPGGETNHGWTVATARKYGYKGPMRSMTWEQAVDLYEQKFFVEPRYADVAQYSKHLAAKLCDIAVNQGIGMASLYLQKALNSLNRGGTDYADIKEDGDLGAKSLHALGRLQAVRGALGLQAITGAVTAQQYVRYMDIARSNPVLEKYMYGWFLRAGNL